MTSGLKRRLLAGALALIPWPAFAQTTGEPPDATLSEAVVVATRAPEPLADVSGAQIVGRAEIERRNAIFAADVLSTVPGLDLTRDGDFGGVTSVRLRGAPSDKTLVLIDGVPVNDPSQPAGGFDFGSFDLADVERIEILPGPQGSLWGSDAIGGVVDIVTREPNGERASAEYGSYDTWRATGAAGVSNPTEALGISASAMGTEGISKADVVFGNTERDPFRNLTLGANARIGPADGVTLEARLRYNHARTDYDDFGGPTGVTDGWDVSDATEGSGFLRASIRSGLGYTQVFTFDQSSIDRIYDSAFPFKANGARTDWRWMAAPDPKAAFGLTLGLEHEHDSENTGSGRVDGGDDAGFAIARWAPDPRLSLTASVRRDDPQGYTGKTTARVGAGVALGVGFTLAASYGQGFKVPSLYETTYPCFECIKPGPNPNLTPETAQGEDATLSWASPDKASDASITLYELTIDGRIDYVYPLGYLNVAHAHSVGVDGQARIDLGRGFAFRAGAGWIQATDTLTGDQLGIPRYSGTAGLDWTSSKWQAAFLARAQTGALGYYGRTKGFAVAEFTGGYALTERIRLTLRVENVADRHYEVVYGYGEPTRSAYLGAALRY